jgi:hypothetical protein
LEIFDATIGESNIAGSLLGGLYGGRVVVQCNTRYRRHSGAYERELPPVAPPHAMQVLTQCRYLIRIVFDQRCYLKVASLVYRLWTIEEPKFG